MCPGAFTTQCSTCNSHCCSENGHADRYFLGQLDQSGHFRRSDHLAGDQDILDAAADEDLGLGQFGGSDADAAARLQLPFGDRHTCFLQLKLLFGRKSFVSGDGNGFWGIT